MAGSRKSIDEIVKLLRANVGSRGSREVFTDMVALTALSVRNAVSHYDPADGGDEGWRKREDQYLGIASYYSREELYRFTEVWARITVEMEQAPRDIFGELYMRLELGDKQNGQFFTPYSVAELMAAMLIDPELEKLRGMDRIPMMEPACGAGAFLIAVTQRLRSAGVNYQRRLWVEAEDISEVAVQMTYLQLTLLHVQAEIRQQNTLTRELFDTWRTPALVLGPDLYLWNRSSGKDEKRESVSEEGAA